MIERTLGLWQSIKHFFQFLNTILAELSGFIPLYIQGALALVFFFAVVLFIVKFVTGLLKVISTLWLGLTI